LLYPYHLASFCLTSFQSTGIGSYARLKGKKVHNGPPRGVALVTARNIIRLSSGGFKEEKDYTVKQIAWGQTPSISKAEPLATGSSAVRAGIVMFTIPFVFCLLS
jgi:hypothetical protein